MRKEECKKKWHILWTNASHGPWISQKDIKNEKYKRDESVFESFCPYRMKVNRKFDDHMKASIARDLGNQSKQDEALKFHELQTSELNKSLPKILEVIELSHTSNEDFQVDNKQHEFDCELVKITGCFEGKFVICKGYARIELQKGKAKTIYYKEIVNIFKRRRYHQINSLEIFTVSGKTYFLHFIDANPHQIIKKILAYELPKALYIQRSRDFVSFFNEQKFTEKWMNYEMSTFDYLMTINIFSGRTYNDASQYPFLPWTLNDYTSNYIDLSDPIFYRDLSLPVGAIGKERFDMLRTRVECGQTQFLYSSFAVCPLSVFLWLIRVECFTSLHIEMQSGKFDVPSRIFGSISDAFNLATTRLGDYRELIPEFFFMPEFLQNKNNFDFGKKNDVQVDDVNLPPWAKSAIHFVYTMRKSLESDVVSKTINKWIDMFFGVDQKSDKNSYNPCLYPSIWTKENKNNQEKREEIEASISNLGAMPTPLFTSKHPQRNQKPVKKDLQFPKLKLGDDLIIKSAFLDAKTDTIKFITADTLTISKITKRYTEISTLKSYKYENIEKIASLDITLTKNSTLANFESESIKQLTNISVVCVGNDLNAAVTDDATLNIFNSTDLLFSVPFYGETIRCLDIAQNFGVVACGTASSSASAGFVTLCRIDDGTKISSIEHKFAPSIIKITKKWGFILCFDSYGNFSVTTINGEKIIDDMCLKREINCATTWTNSSGFDFFAAAFDDGKIVISEAFYGFDSPNKQSYRCFSKVIEMQYCSQIGSLVCITESGSVHIYYVDNVC